MSQWINALRGNGRNASSISIVGVVPHYPSPLLTAWRVPSPLRSPEVIPVPASTLWRVSLLPASLVPSSLIIMAVPAIIVRGSLGVVSAVSFLVCSLTCEDASTVIIVVFAGLFLEASFLLRLVFAGNAALNVGSKIRVPEGGMQILSEDLLSVRGVSVKASFFYWWRPEWTSRLDASLRLKVDLRVFAAFLRRALIGYLP
jgi:hypothetical protein